MKEKKNTSQSVGHIMSCSFRVGLYVKIREMKKCRGVRASMLKSGKFSSSSEGNRVSGTGESDYALVV